MTQRLLGYIGTPTGSDPGPDKALPLENILSSQDEMMQLRSGSMLNKYSLKVHIALVSY